MDFQFRGSGADKTIDLRLHFTWFTIHGFLIPTGLQHGKYGVLYSVTLKVRCHCNHEFYRLVYWYDCNGVQREHNKKLNNGLPILHKVPPKRDYGRYFCIMAEKGGTFHGGLTEKLSPFFHAKKQEVNAYGR